MIVSVAEVLKMMVASSSVEVNNRTDKSSVLVVLCTNEVVTGVGCITNSEQAADIAVEDNPKSPAGVEITFCRL